MTDSSTLQTLVKSTENLPISSGPNIKKRFRGSQCNGEKFNMRKTMGTKSIKFKKMRMKAKNIEEKNFRCPECFRDFKYKKPFEKHLKLYPFKHKYIKSCNKVCRIRDTNLHETNNIENTIPSTSKKSKKSAIKRNDKSVVGEKEAINNKENIELEEDVKSTADKICDSVTNDIFKVQEDVCFAPSDDELSLDLFFQGRKQKPCKPRSKPRISKTALKKYQCDVCDKSFNTKTGMCNHFTLTHLQNGNFKCHICDSVFENETLFKSHKNLHDPSDKVVCKGCKKEFNTFKAYKVHSKMYPGKHCFNCRLCVRTFPSELLLEQHVCICTNGKPLLCACGSVFTKYSAVVEHAKGSKPFLCCTCSHGSTSLTAHLRHIRKHSKQKPFQCLKCPASFAIIDFLNSHTKKNHEETPVVDSKVETKEESTAAPTSKVFKCYVCESSFLVEKDFKEHKRTHPERIPCPDCGKMLKRSRLASHKNTHKTTSSLCPECGKLFDTRFKLSQHIVTTHGSDPVTCDICEKVLKTKKIYNEHMKTHIKSDVGTRVPQAICPVCGLGLAQKGSLARHILLMHERHKVVPCNKVYECKLCGEKVKSTAKYYTHMRAHRAMVERYPCTTCGREFNKKQNLRRHMYLLHDDKRIIQDPIYGCEVCSRSFREKKNLRRHYKMVHKLES